MSPNPDEIAREIKRLSELANGICSLPPSWGATVNPTNLLALIERYERMREALELLRDIKFTVPRITIGDVNLRVNNIARAALQDTPTND